MAGCSGWGECRAVEQAASSWCGLTPGAYSRRKLPVVATARLRTPTPHPLTLVHLALLRGRHVGVRHEVLIQEHVHVGLAVQGNLALVYA